MSGLVFDYYKNILEEKHFKSLFENDDIFKRNHEVFKNNSFITFGNFDWLAIRKVTDFSRFRDVSENAKMWIGERQSVLLYELDEPYDIEFINGVEQKNFYIKDNKKNDFLFIGLSIFQFDYNEFLKQELSENTPFENEFSESLKGLRLKIKTILENTDMICEVYGTLGNLGIAVIWLTDQYTKVLNFVDKIKASTPFIFSSYTIFSQNNECDKNKIDQIDGEALVQLAIKSNINSNLSNYLKYQPDLT